MDGKQLTDDRDRAPRVTLFLCVGQISAAAASISSSFPSQPSTILIAGKTATIPKLRYPMTID